MRNNLIGLLALTWACGGTESGEDATGNPSGSAGAGSTSAILQGTSGQAGLANAQPAECQLQERPNGPLLTLQGTVCGESKSLSTTAGQLIKLSRSSLLAPIDEITTFTLKDDPSDYAATLPDYFDDFSLLFNVVLERGPELEVQTADYPVEKGMLVACGFGSLVLGSGLAQVSIENLAGAPSGQVRISISELPVSGFDPSFGKLNVPACTGSVAVTLEGTFEHDPG